MVIFTFVTLSFLLTIVFTLIIFFTIKKERRRLNVLQGIMFICFILSACITCIIGLSIYLNAPEEKVTKNININHITFGDEKHSIYYLNEHHNQLSLSWSPYYAPRKYDKKIRDPEYNNRESKSKNPYIYFTRNDTHEKSSVNLIDAHNHIIGYRYDYNKSSKVKLHKTNKQSHIKMTLKNVKKDSLYYKIFKKEYIQKDPVQYDIYLNKKDIDLNKKDIKRMNENFKDVLKQSIQDDDNSDSHEYRRDINKLENISNINDKTYKPYVKSK